MSFGNVSGQTKLFLIIFTVFQHKQVILCQLNSIKPLDDNIIILNIILL